MKSKRICKNGHDISICGRTSSNNCKLCDSKWRITYRKEHPEYMEKFKEENPQYAEKKKKTNPLYNTWVAMNQRCYNTKKEAYHNYGGRGITVCDEWRDSYQAWYDYVSKLPHLRRKEEHRIVLITMVTTNQVI